MVIDGTKLKGVVISGCKNSKGGPFELRPMVTFLYQQEPMLLNDDLGLSHYVVS
jgi:hypothetical protein